ncbi:MAG: hypothetical protein H6977_10445 [Gammaproteobacteria bacterium]|nr:hypothetical protein [Gammaproteobacteria bacterium]
MLETTFLSTRRGRIVAALALLLLTSRAPALTLSVMVGDDDGFGGTQGLNSDAGDPYTNFAGPVIAPSGAAYVGTAGLDASTAAPWTPYAFEFTFDWDTTALASVADARVTVQSGSVARRGDGSGYGFAQVSASGVGLGDFWSQGTGAAASAAEENVKAHVFDVSTFIAPAAHGSLTVRVDGTALVNPVDQFALDFAVLSISGTPVPLPPAALLLGGGLCSVLAAGRRRRRCQTASPA